MLLPRIMNSAIIWTKEHWAVAFGGFGVAIISGLASVLWDYTIPKSTSELASSIKTSIGSTLVHNNNGNYTNIQNFVFKPREDAGEIIEKLIGALTEMSKDERHTVEARRDFSISADRAQYTESDLIKAVDQILKSLQAHPNDKAEAEAAIESLKAGKTEKSIQFLLKEAKRNEARADQANKEASETLKNLGAFHFLKGTNDAIYYYKKSISYSPNDHDSWNGLGRLMLRIGDFNGAESAFNKIIDIGIKNNDKIALIRGHGNIGLVYQKRRNYEKAEISHGIAYTYAQSIGKNDSIAIQKGNLANIYRIRNNLVAAEKYRLEALDIAIKNRYNAGTSYQIEGLAKIYQDRGDYEHSLAYHAKALDIMEAAERRDYESKIHRNMGSIYVIMGNAEEANRHLVAALRLAEDISSKDDIAYANAFLGLLSHKNGETIQATLRLKESLRIFNEMELQADADWVSDALESVRKNDEVEDILLAAMRY
ncbi:tetratricopeptide repeat protein [Azospirillum argentinense]